MRSWLIDSPLSRGFCSFAIIIWELITRRAVFEGMMGFQIAIEVGTQGRRPPIPSEEEVCVGMSSTAALTHSLTRSLTRSLTDA
jgi:hypothetical protein